MRDHSWAHHLDSMEGIEIDQSASTKTRTFSRKWRVSAIWPGLALTVSVGLLAWLVSRAPFWPFTNASGAHPLDAVVVATVLAIVLANLGIFSERSRPGIAYAARKLLPISVMLLGARLDFIEMLAIGGRGLLLSCLLVGLTFLLFAALARFWKFSAMEALLLGVGTAICGGTAIVAVAPVVRAKQAEIALSVATVTLVGLAAMFVMPVIGSWLNLDAEAFGMWAGLVIHQTPQVIAAGFAFSPEAGQVATVVKLARVCLLAPVIIVLGLIWTRSRGSNDRESIKPWWRHIPWFVIGFVVMAMLRTVGLLPELDVTWNTSRILPPMSMEISVQRLLTGMAAFLLVVAMAGVGLETKFAAFQRSSLRAVAAAALAFVVLAGVALTVV